MNYTLPQRIAPMIIVAIVVSATAHQREYFILKAMEVIFYDLSIVIVLDMNDVGFNPGSLKQIPFERSIVSPWMVKG